MYTIILYSPYPIHTNHLSISTFISTYTFTYIGVNEIQRITCTATSGNFTVLFRDNSTMTMDYDVSVANFTHRLKQIYT